MIHTKRPTPKGRLRRAGGLLLIIVLLLAGFPAYNRLKSEIPLSVPEQSEPHQNEAGPDDTISLVSVPYISQENLLPTGCELVSAVMLLRFEGSTASVHDFADAIPKGEIITQGNRKLGPDPHDVFVGDPYSSSGYGCYAPVIADTLNTFLPEGRKAVADENLSLPELARRCEEEGLPALIWATMNMEPSRPGTCWVLPSGNEFQWISREHCLVLLGADDSCYYFNDPYQSHGRIAYDREVVEQRYRELGSQSVIVIDAK